VKLVLKLAVIASSVLLLAGFVAYRAGAFNWLFEPALMGSSKSAKIFLPPATTQPQPPEVTPLDPTIMSSSKSIAPLIVQPPPASPADKPPAPVILPGSKSDTIVKPPANKPADAPQKPQ
jgi:hypothetical protein